MMNADKQVLYSGVPQEEWAKSSKYPRIMSNGPKPPKPFEKSKKSSGLIPFMILTGLTILISTGVVIGLHYLKYTEEDGLVFSSLIKNKTTGGSTYLGSDTLKPKPLPAGNKNPIESENPDIPQNPKDKSANIKESSPKVEPSEKDTGTKASSSNPDVNKDLTPTNDNQDQETNSNTNNPENGQEKDEHTVDNEHTPEGENINNDKASEDSEDTIGDEIQNPAEGPTDILDITEDEDDWLDIIKTDGEHIFFQKPSTQKTEEGKKNEGENSPSKKEDEEKKEENEEKENKKDENGENVLEKKDIADSSKNEGNKEDNEKEGKEGDKEEEKDKEGDKVDKEGDKEDKEGEKVDKKVDQEGTSLLYETINNIAQKYFNSTSLNPTQIKELFKNMSVGPSLEVIIIASGIIFVGLSLLIIAITCLVTRTRNIRIRREKIKKAVSDLEGAEKIILLTDEQSEDEFVKT